MSNDTGALPCNDTNLFISKYILPFAIFFQVYSITLFPSEASPKLRVPFRLLSVLGAGLLMLIWDCTSFYNTTGLLKGPTLLYGGVEPTYGLFSLGVLFWSAAAFLFCKPFWVCRNILIVGGINLILLLIFDGTIRLVSKLCFYCLQLSIMWLLEPKFVPPPLCTGEGDKVVGGKVMHSQLKGIMTSS